MQERKACNPEFKEHCKQTKKRSLQKRQEQKLRVTQTLGIIRLPPKTKLVPIYNRYYNSDKDEFNNKEQRIVTYKEVLVGYNPTTL